MGLRRPRRDEEVGRSFNCRASTRYSTVQKRRLVLWGLCGVLFFSAAPLGCTRASSLAPVSDDVLLTIGMAEGSLAGTDVGVRQLAGTLSLEGLTQLSFDGRVLPSLAENSGGNF